AQGWYGAGPLALNRGVRVEETPRFVLAVSGRRIACISPRRNSTQPAHSIGPTPLFLCVLKPLGRRAILRVHKADSDKHGVTTHDDHRPESQRRRTRRRSYAVKPPPRCSRLRRRNTAT